MSVKRISKSKIFGYLPLAILTISPFFCCVAHTLDDHQGREDHRETDRIFNDAQKQTGAGDQGKDSYNKENDSENSDGREHRANAGDWFGVPDRDK